MQCGLWILLGWPNYSIDHIERTMPLEFSICLTDLLHSHASMVVFIPTTSLKVIT